LTDAVERGEATAVQQAYLTDRVLLHEGQPQEYGTQAVARDGRFEARRLRDPDRVDERRAGVGLSPLAGYLARMAEHRAPEPMWVPCGVCQAPIEVWPPDLGEPRTATCPECGLLHTFRTNSYYGTPGPAESKATSTKPLAVRSAAFSMAGGSERPGPAS
jgi:hypothetical protein